MRYLRRERQSCSVFNRLYLSLSTSYRIALMYRLAIAAMVTTATDLLKVEANGIAGSSRVHRISGLISG